MDEQVIIHKQVDENKDSIEIGTPSKGGAVKVYCDFNKIEESQEKIRKAFVLRKYANEKMSDVV